MESAGVAESDVTNGGIFSYITRLKAEIQQQKSICQLIKSNADTFVIYFVLFSC